MNSNQGMQSPLSPPALPPHRRAYPSKLFVEATTRCNLGCFMCVKQTDGCGMTEGDLTPGIFAAVEPALPHLEALILNGIGEPLLNPHLAEFIRKAKRLMPATGWIGFQSNGLLLTNLRAISLVEAGLDRICLSMDAASPETFRKVREGSDIPDIEHAMAALNAAKERCNRPEVRVGIEFVLMRSNLGELPAALRWAAEHGATFAVVTHVLPYDDQHADEAAYGSCSAAAIALFGSYRAIAAQQGLDIYRYFEARWKYRRNPDEQKLVAVIEAMKAEADARDIFVDMKKLLQLDTRRIEDVVAVFAQARAVALECGLDLRLPEVTLREKRHCSFVEDGGAFISWEGNVSPCYFLWHRYRCFASGWHQQVQPKVFGNLAEQGMLEIWNDPAFRSFREQVVDYDYPDCSSCTLAPCDYVQTERFEQDCHIRDIPCGACLWCMGIFQCLQ
ncbi:radical SAM/SPASM domain-containing protein [Geotalea uraniireducens]|uniref:Radical SAM domain protein n=1 Tax=Geotalea uraniireducens (strain Rf4) TaxID=351605 RepID=A5G7H4_GEOUR|nr:radical SAM/SPASM domain-containing protein [Geotalea uraniireducens]ABQ27742.1 Radical SAM domain protein [Geotalea uraniireducens Rf4]